MIVVNELAVKNMACKSRNTSITSQEIILMDG